MVSLDILLILDIQLWRLITCETVKSMQNLALMKRIALLWLKHDTIGNNQLCVFPTIHVYSKMPGMIGGQPE